ncbi:MAG: AAA family ATPase [Xanthobacteraceae bacterium]|nr:AAA family ATPase [Xanthobacteraceae bacterium]
MKDDLDQSSEAQEAVFRFLADPATHDGAAVKRIDTHAASVFLAGPSAYKVKRAVRFPFLDFSTLEKRKAALDAEITANRPFAPELYLEVLPVVRRDGTLTLGGDDPAVEWALKMRRFDETQTLDFLADAGRIDKALIEELARAVAAAHERAPIADAHAWITALSEYVEQNDVALRERADLFDPQRVDTLTARSRTAFARVRSLLVERGAQGLIRRGHGDLHLSNIALIDGRPVPFDALEFDPVVASGDLLYDLAFLLMDLIERMRQADANLILNVYLEETRRRSDLDALAALPLFMSVRAAIRAKVTAAKLDGARPEEREAIAAQAKAYFVLACNLIAPAPPRLVAVGGLSGTGKSVLARALAPHVAPAPGAVLIRSDVERKAMFGLAQTEKLPPQAYTPEVGQRVYAVLADKARRVVAAGHSAIVDAVFAREAERASMTELARTHRFAFRGLFLTADLAVRIARIGDRLHDASDANAEVARQQEHYTLGALDWMQIEATGTPEQTLARAKVAIDS